MPELANTIEGGGVGLWSTTQRFMAEHPVLLPSSPCTGPARLLPVQGCRLHACKAFCHMHSNLNTAGTNDGDMRTGAAAGEELAALRAAA